MKHSTKLAFYLLTTISIFFASCEKDLYDDALHNKTERSVSKISFEKFKQQTGINDFATAIEVPLGINSITNRTAQLSDFTINIEQILEHISAENKITYSFKIIPLTFTPEEREKYNLVYHKENGIWETAIFVMKEKEVINPSQGIFEEIQELYDSRAGQTMTDYIGCFGIEYTDFHCTGCTVSCDLCIDCVTTTVVLLDCGGLGGGGDGGDGGDGNTDGGGGNDNIEYSPNLGDDLPESDYTLPQHITQLNKLTRNKPDGTKTIFKKEIDSLKSRLTTSYEEDGLLFGSEFAPIIPECTKNSTEWTPGFPTSYYVAIHMHQNMYYAQGTTLKPSNPVTSDQDVKLTLNLYNYNNNRNTTSVLVSRQGTFALRIGKGSFAKLAANALKNDKVISEIFETDYNKQVQDLYETNDEAGALAAFTNFINEYKINGQGLGLVLFQAVYDTEENIINWVKL